MNKTILITGAFGFVGSNLSKSLSTTFNHRLIAVDVVAPECHSYNEVFIPMGYHPSALYRVTFSLK